MRERRSLLSWIFGAPRSDHHLHKVIHSIEQKVNTIMATQAELAQRLREIQAQNEKARAENARLLQELRDAISNAGSTTPEVDEALTALAASIQAEDDENPDAPPV